MEPPPRRTGRPRGRRSPARASQRSALRGTVAVRAVAHVIEVGVSAGIHRDLLMDAAAVAEADLRDPDGRLPLSAEIALWQMLAKHVTDAGFGVRAGAAQELRQLGLLGYVASFSATVRDARRRVQRYGRVFTEAVEFRLHDQQPQVALAVGHPELGPGHAPVPFAAEMELYYDSRSGSTTRPNTPRDGRSSNAGPGARESIDMGTGRRVTPPQQARSEETRRRIGDAMATLLEERPYASITIGDICERASASPSSFYARFEDKGAVLDWVRSEYFDESQRTLGERLDPDRWAGQSLETIVRSVMDAYVAFLRRHCGILRAIALENRMHSSGAVAERSRTLNLLSHERITGLVLTRADEITHPDPGFAASFGLTMVYATSQEFVLFGDVGLHPLRPGDDTLARALADAYLAVLRPR